MLSWQQFYILRGRKNSGGNSGGGYKHGTSYMIGIFLVQNYSVHINFCKTEQFHLKSEEYLTFRILTTQSRQESNVTGTDLGKISIEQLLSQLLTTL